MSANRYFMQRVVELLTNNDSLTPTMCSETPAPAAHMKAISYGGYLTIVLDPAEGRLSIQFVPGRGVDQGHVERAQADLNKALLQATHELLGLTFTT